MSKRGLIVIAGLVVLVGVILAALLGVASGEGPAGSTAARTISVEGTATVPIGIRDSASEATTVYRDGMANALIDAQAKASFLAEKSGGSAGAALSIVEDGGSIECTGAFEEEGSATYARYEGEQPDFGWGHDPGVVLGSSGAAAPTSAASSPEKAVSHRPKAKKRKRRHTAKKAATSTSNCNLTANVAAVYALA